MPGIIFFLLSSQIVLYVSDTSCYHKQILNNLKKSLNLVDSRPSTFGIHERAISFLSTD